MREPITSVLFVCLGNICRSPLAEGIFLDLLRRSGLEDRFQVDSAGTGAYHTGEGPDPWSVAVAQADGIHLTGLARQVTRQDFRSFDVIVAMDRSNRRSLEHIRAGADPARIVMMRDFDDEAPGSDVPDPYYGGSGGFERVYEILRRSCEGLLDELTPGSPI